MSDGTSLGDRMKMYERVWTGKFTRRAPLVVRVDGRAFHTYLRGAEKPFDAVFSSQMRAVAMELVAEVAGSVFAYGQSDEISLLVCDYRTHETQPWFGGGIQKIASVCASIATARLGQLRPGGPTFDGRAFVLPSDAEVANYFVWRQRDAMRNAVSMAAQAHFPYGDLQGVNVEGMKQMLADGQVDFEDYPAEFRFGFVTRPSSDTGTAAPPFAAAPGNWLASVIPPIPTLAQGETSP